MWVTPHQPPRPEDVPIAPPSPLDVHLGDPLHKVLCDALRQEFTKLSRDLRTDVSKALLNQLTASQSMELEPRAPSRSPRRHATYSGGNSNLLRVPPNGFSMRPGAPTTAYPLTNGINGHSSNGHSFLNGDAPPMNGLSAATSNGINGFNGRGPAAPHETLEAFKRMRSIPALEDAHFSKPGFHEIPLAPEAPPLPLQVKVEPPKEMNPAPLSLPNMLPPTPAANSNLRRSATATSALDHSSSRSPSEAELDDLGERSMMTTNWFRSSSYLDLSPNAATGRSSSKRSRVFSGDIEEITSMSVHAFHAKHREPSNVLSPYRKSAGSNLHTLIFEIVSSSYFEWVAMVGVFMNSVSVGVATDYMARHVGESMPTEFRALDIGFCIVFTAELCLRLLAFRGSFFTMKGCLWNMFDLFLVGFQLFEEGLMLIAKGGESALANMMPGTALRLIRLLRAVRVLRILRVMRFTEDLQVLVSCIMHSMRSFGWASALLLLLIYVESIYLTSAVMTYKEDKGTDTPEADELTYWYGNVPLAVLTLFQSLTGGVDWNDIVRPLLDHVSSTAGIVAICWIAFSVLVVMNIVTGIFVDTAMGRASEVREAAKINKARKMFQRIDLDTSGSIQFEELMQHLDAEEVQAFFRDVDVDVSEAELLFTLLDCNRSGSIEFEEFISGCLRLQGYARAVDLLLVSKEQRTAATKMVQIMSDLEERVGKFVEAAIAVGPTNSAASEDC